MSISDSELAFLGSHAQHRIVLEMAQELLEHRQHDRTPCLWKQDKDGNWETGCGNLFSYIEGGPKENDTKFCQYCGHTVEGNYYD